MYAVIFKAKINTLDDEYFDTAKKMRTLAIEKYGCKDFISCSEENIEIAISYWDSKEQIREWKNDPEHQKAQILGKKNWYKSYQVEIVEILHSY